jgi:hypothetical protein
MTKQILLGIYNLTLGVFTTLIEIGMLKPPHFWYKMFWFIIVPKLTAFASYDFYLFFVLQPLGQTAMVETLQYAFAVYMLYFETPPELVEFIWGEPTLPTEVEHSENLPTKEQKQDEFRTYRRNFRLLIIFVAVCSYIIRSNL